MTVAPRDAKRFMDSGVIVHVIVDAVAPGVSPAVRFEKVFEHGRGVLAVIERDSFSIDDQRPARMIWDETIVLEPDLVGLSHSREVNGLPLAGASKTGCALRVSLQVFKGWHDRPPLKYRSRSRSKAGGPVREPHPVRSPRRHHSPSAPESRCA